MKRETNYTSIPKITSTRVSREDTEVGHRLGHRQAFHPMHLRARHLRHHQPRQEGTHHSIMQFQMIGIILSLVRQVGWRSHPQSARAEHPLWERI